VYFWPKSTYVLLTLVVMLRSLVRLSVVTSICKALRVL